MKAILDAKLAPPAPSTSSTTSSSDPIPTEPFKDLKTIVPEIIHRKQKDSKSQSFCTDIEKLISDSTDQKSGTIKIHYRSRKNFEVKVNNKAFFGEQQKAWADLIKPLETELTPLTPDLAKTFLDNLFVNLSALATYNIATPQSVLLLLFLKMNPYADQCEQTMAARCLGIPIHIYSNEVRKEGLPFRLEPIIGSSPHSLNIFYDFYGPKNLLNHFSPVFITEAGTNIPKLVPVQMLVDLGLVESEEDGETKRNNFNKRNQLKDPADTSILNIDFSSIGALLFGGANANELQSEGASGDSKAEKEADKPSNDAIAMHELAKGDLDLADLVHPKGESTYRVEGVTNFNVNWYQGTRK